MENSIVTSNSTHNSHLSRDDRLRAQTLRIHSNLSYELIAKKLDITYRQAQYACTQPAVTPKKRSGRPTILTEEEVDEIVAFVTTNHRSRLMSYKQVAATILGGKHDERTIQRALQKRGYKRYVAIKKPKLSEVHKAARLAWALEHRNWSKQQWNNVLWSDETWVNGYHRKTYVTRMHSEMLHDDCIVHRVQRPEGWMFWGSFAGITKGPCLFWEKDWGTIDGENYRSRIVPIVEGWVRTMDVYEGKLLVFMQDNAPAHSHQLTKEDLQERGIEVMVWPALSPDLNPIENVWNKMKEYIQKHHGVNDIFTLNYDQLRSLINEAWQNVEQDYLESLIDSMGERCQAVIDAAGGHTKY